MPRLVARSEIDGWARQLTDAVNAAGRKQRLSLGSVIRSHGGTWDAPAGTLPAAVWSPEAWAAAVNTEVAPVAAKVAAEVFASARRRLPASVTWGASVPTERLADMVTARALAAGPGIARRVSMASLTAAMTAQQVADAVANAPERYGGITHPEARQTTADAYASAIDQLNTLIDRVAGQMGNAAQSVLAETVDRNQADPVLNVWMSALTPTTREDHAMADGQTQRPGDPFDIGGEQLMWPGDPSGSDEQICNCLCWLESVGGAFDDVTGTADEAEGDAEAA